MKSNRTRVRLKPTSRRSCPEICCFSLSYPATAFITARLWWPYRAANQTTLTHSMSTTNSFSAFPASFFDPAAIFANSPCAMMALRSWRQTLSRAWDHWSNWVSASTRFRSSRNFYSPIWRAFRFWSWTAIVFVRYIQSLLNVFSSSRNSILKTTLSFLFLVRFLAIVRTWSCFIWTKM